jgi:hypothetical protein
MNRRPAMFVPATGGEGIEGASVDLIFYRKLSDSLAQRAKDLYRDYVEAFGPDRAAEEWKKIAPARVGRGAPKGAHDPQRDKTLLLAYWYFEEKYPRLKGRALRIKVAEYFKEYFKGIYGANVNAIQTQIDRIVKRRVMNKKRP